ncbi:hypothetical protein J31TS4_18770 [Paenibacillus sp. J31TS4]|uniref:hypothetical protein n=1 Tax=Paenibacillus sp. J31TS4 TaxID=2807195 RepID=UPI001B21EFAB|nr:hypothetical protein [Paenibacillus sp. J31TS4]GIP38597.1 hypothetical protein J31TS4_18770 [Paenibacillus sp. J31TS4]
MSISGKQIQSEDEYKKALDWLVLTAAELADPLKDMPPEERQKKRLIYDRTSELVTRYRRGELVRDFPGLRKIYAEIGYSFNEPAVREPAVTPPAQQPEPEPTPTLPQQPTKQSKLADWLDDD